MVRVLGPQHEYRPNQTESTARSFFGTLVNHAKPYREGQAGSSQDIERLAALMAVRIEIDPELSRSTVIVAVPGSNAKKVYDLPQRLTAQIGLWINIPVAGISVLRKSRSTSQLKNLPEAERNAEVRNSMVADNRSLFGKRVLLLDDLFGTGSTMREAIRAVDEAGAAEVFGIAATCNRGSRGLTL